MSLSDADKNPEFASRITYEAREDLAKDESQPAATCNFHGRGTTRLSYVRLRGTYDEKEYSAARGLNLPIKRVAGVR